jgi:DNA-directed RNA polymerase specialized sigma24 family protein
LADALVGVGRALTTLGLRLRELDGDAVSQAAANELPVEVAATGALPKGGLGPRQRAVLALPGLVATHGLSAADVAKAVNVTQGNAHNVLKRLEELGYLEAVKGERPARWRRVG